LIGVIAKESESSIVEEFFQLFKTPWEFCREGQSYETVIASAEELPTVDAALIIFYNSSSTQFDVQNELLPELSDENLISASLLNLYFPVYGKVSAFRGNVHPGLVMEMSQKAVAAEVGFGGKKVIRVGFDLFQEIFLLLTSGQPVEFSHIPTLDLHISVLRQFILDSGMPLIEIPPVPAGYDYACCLTHDIDFAGIRRHKFDYTILGFLYRAIIGSLKKVLKGKRERQKLIENWKAVTLLPAVYMGLADDFWMQFDNYLKIEGGFRSTFFIIPFKNIAGAGHAGGDHLRRAVRYDISDIKPEIRDLLAHGCEIGVHGIDSWIDAEKAGNEFDRIYETAGLPEIGIRMHWLYLNDRSYGIMEKTGYMYDSTSGYNDSVGYRSGTVQVFRPIGLEKLFELPLNVQDTALFYPDRMGLSEDEAWPLIRNLLKNAEMYGGVLTINWHDRSLAPERLWGDFYIKFVETLKHSRAWVDTGSQVVRWFDKRRSASFKEVENSGEKVKISVGSRHYDGVPGLVLRIHNSDAFRKKNRDSGGDEGKYFDINFEDVLTTEISL
jgi:hypothetical protein